MLKKIVCIAISFILATSFFISSFIVNADDLDFLETHTVPAPTVPSDGNLLSNDELVTEFNEDYYNEDHLVEDETETGEFFDEKADFHITEDISGLPNSSKLTNEDFRSPSFNSANSTKVTEISQQLVENGIMTIADDDYKDNFEYSDFFDLNNWNKFTYYLDPVVLDPERCLWVFRNVIPKFLPQLKDDPDYLYMVENYDIENLIIFNFESSGKIFYGFFLVNEDMRCYFNSDRDRYEFEHSYSVYVCDYIWFCHRYNVYNFNASGFSFNHKTMNIKNNINIIFSGGYNVYFDDEKCDVIDPETGFTTGKIKGEFGFKEDSKILTYKAWSDKELDKTFDVHLWAMDSSFVPAKINGSEDFPIRDLDNYDSHGLQLSSSKSSVQASYELEAVYYYLHHMKGYDDSLESVDGYDFEEFESRENLNFAIAYRENGSSGDWIVCKSYQYNYGDLIENVMGSFTVKKDYVDFPDMSDYIEDFESWDDVAADCADEDGEYNIIEVGFKWIGRNVMHFAHNFVGFFQWLFDCVPILWENLTIALYNLVCDLKELALYFVNPKTKSIYAMTCERIPSFSLLVDSFKNTSGADLPSFKIFGCKFSLDFNDYSIDFSFIRSMSTILFYILFGYLVFKLIFKIFGFGGSGGGDED